MFAASVAPTWLIPGIAAVVAIVLVVLGHVGLARAGSAGSARDGWIAALIVGYVLLAIAVAFAITLWILNATLFASVEQITG